MYISVEMGDVSHRIVKHTPCKWNSSTKQIRHHSFLYVLYAHA